MAHELELAVDVAERLAQELAAALGVDVLALQLRAHLGARLLGASSVLSSSSDTPRSSFRRITSRSRSTSASV